MPTATFPTWLAGNRITASQLNAGLPQSVIKQNDESVTSSTALQNDNELVSATLVVSAQYRFECFLDYEGGTLGASDIQWEWAVPSGATMRYSASFFGGGGGYTGLLASAGTIAVASSNGAGVLRPVYMNGTLIMGGTAGTMQLKWAQNTSSATPTIVHAQSQLSLIRTS